MVRATGSVVRAGGASVVRAATPIAQRSSQQVVNAGQKVKNVVTAPLTKTQVAQTSVTGLGAVGNVAVRYNEDIQDGTMDDSLLQYGGSAFLGGFGGRIGYAQGFFKGGITAGGFGLMDNFILDGGYDQKQLVNEMTSHVLSEAVSFLSRGYISGNDIETLSSAVNELSNIYLNVYGK